MGSEAERFSRVEATVSGEVQGVGYRYLVQSIARRLGVKGYVQNMPDGTVRVVAEAPEQVIEAFIKKLNIKEAPINVENVMSTYSKLTGEFQSFAVRFGDLTEEMAEGFASGLKYMNVSRQETKEGFQTLGNETKQGFQTLGSEMREGFQTLGNETKQEFQALRSEMREGFQTVGNKIGSMHEDMNRNFEEMSERYDAISGNLTQAVKMIQEESTKTRIELTRAVDNLSKLVEEFLKERHGQQ